MWRPHGAALKAWVQPAGRGARRRALKRASGSATGVSTTCGARLDGVRRGVAREAWEAASGKGGKGAAAGRRRGEHHRLGHVRVVLKAGGHIILA